jgi:pimeloyl-ACP methyl ester carboxylesterase
VTVHYGFQRALDYPDKTTGMRSVEALLMHIQRLNLLDRPIFIVGHSLGGAIATLFAVKFRAAHPSAANRLLQKVVTFGAPAVGGNAFYDYYGDLHERTTRYVNRADAVPFTPPIGYRHVGREIWLSPNAVRTDMKWPERLRYALGLGAQSMGRDHFIASYIEGLERITIEPGRSRVSL